MAKQGVGFYHVNGGEISALSLARVDIDKMRLAAEKMVNWVPLAQGPMTLRPGTKYLGTTKSNNAARLLEFIYSTDDAALLELTNGVMRVWQNDALVERETVTSTIQSYGSWTTSASTGSTVTTSGSNLVIYGVTKGNRSYAYGTISCGSNTGKKHGLKFQVNVGGDILFKIGTSAGADDVIPTTTLAAGYHSIGFVPSVSTLYVQLESNDLYTYNIGPMSFESAGAVEVPTIWGTSDLPSVRYDQSADVVFVACSGKRQQMIQRRAGNSWSVVDYQPKDGPFPAAAGDATVKLTPSTTTGDVTLTSNKSFFSSSMVGALLRVFHNGHIDYRKLNVAATGTDGIRVSGVSNYVPCTPVFSGTAGIWYYFDPTTGGIVGGPPFPAGFYLSDDRKFSITLAGTWAGTVVLQRTFDPDGKVDWADVPGQSWTANTTATYQDMEDNVIAHYRLFLKAYTSGSVDATLTYDGDAGSGVCRIIAVASGTSATVQAFTPFYNTTASADWRLSQWNGDDGYPSSVTLHEGRLWWSGGARIWGSVSDDYTSFDFEKIGDAAPISRSIGKGPIQDTRFMMSLGRLVVGTDAGIVTARSSSFDEPLTPTNFVLKYTNTQGVAGLRGLQLDQKGVFVQRSDRRIYLIDFTAQKFDYQTIDLTRLNTDIGYPGFTDLAIQRQFDTRLWFVRNDGMIAVLVYDEQDEVIAWHRIEAADGGIYENVAVLPNPIEDAVYAVVRRGSSRFVERFARLDQAMNGPDRRLSDAYVYAASASTVTGLSHLNGKTVCAWGGERDLGTFTVSSGQISLGATYSNVVVGLPYQAQWVSTKLAYGVAQGETAVNKVKRVSQIGFVLQDTHYQGVKYGQYDPASGNYTADNLPLIEEGAETAADTIWSQYDQQDFELNGTWTADSRIYIEANSPRPATVLGFTIDMKTSA